VATTVPALRMAANAWVRCSPVVTPTVRDGGAGALAVGQAAGDLGGLIVGGPDFVAGPSRGTCRVEQ
jgi:hypothetical protein